MAISRANLGKTTDKKQKKISKVMREFKKRKLKSGKSNKKVVNRKQAIAIAISEANKKKKRRSSWSKNSKKKLWTSGMTCL